MMKGRNDFALVVLLAMMAAAPATALERVRASPGGNLSTTIERQRIDIGAPARETRSVGSAPGVDIGTSAGPPYSAMMRRAPIGSVSIPTTGATR